MPPGTGDIQLTLFHDFKIDGAVIVSTPQEIALIDARRAAAMLQKLGTPILGVIENMAYFPDPATGAPDPDLRRRAARGPRRPKLGVPLLAEIPIDIALRQGGDEGAPLVVSDPDGAGGAGVRRAGAGAAPAELLRRRRRLGERAGQRFLAPRPASSSAAAPRGSRRGAWRRACSRRTSPRRTRPG